ncbi:MAG: hypothetical protein ABF296_09400 [Oceanococcaceae bacterium]
MTTLIVNGPLEGPPVAGRNPLILGPILAERERVGAKRTDISRAREKGLYTFFGDGVIEGTVTTLGSPTIDTVRLYDRVTGQMVGQTRSKPDGSYRFPGLDTSREYVVVGIDKQRQYEAVARDLITPEAFP